MKKNTNDNGITLIALIITIIVMLILVAVTISVALNGGLFDNAKEAKTGTQRQAEKEELIAKMVGAYDSTGSFATSNVGQLPSGTQWCTEDETSYEHAISNPTSERNWIITKNNNKFYIDENGSVLDEKPEILNVANTYDITIGNLSNITWSSISGLDGGKNYSINFTDENENVSVLVLSTNEYLTDCGGTYLPDSTTFNGAVSFNDENFSWQNQNEQLSSISLSNVTYTSGGTFLGTTFYSLTDEQIRAIISVTPHE